MKEPFFPENILAFLGEGVFALDRGGRVQYLSAAGEKLLGVASGKSAGKLLASFLKPSSSASLKSLLKEGRGEEKLKLELSRGKKTLEFSLSPLEQGKRTVGFVGVIRDISGKQNDLEQARQLAAVVENIGETVVITDHNRRIIYANPAVEEMLGYRPEEMVDRPASRFFKGIPGNPKNLSEYIRTHSGEKGWEAEVFNRRKDGKVIPVHLAVTPLLDRQGVILGYVGISHDISKLKNMEEVRRRYTEKVESEVEKRTAELKSASRDLAEQRARLDAILDNMAEGVVVENGNYEVEFMNDTLIRIFGNQVGRKCFRAFIGRKSPCRNCGMKEIIRNGKDYYRYESIDKNGRNYELVASPLINPNGRRLVIEIVRDITERKKAEDLIRRKNLQLTEINEELGKLLKVKSEFLSLVSHELKSPLTVIQGYLTMIKDKRLGSLNPEQEEGFKIAATEAEHLNYLINQLLDIAHLDSGKFELQKEEFDIKSLVEHCLKTLGEAARKNRITFQVAISPSATTTYGDLNKIKQVFRNILDNAIRSSPNGGKVEIKGGKKGGELHFAVRDEGIGIPKQELEKVFNRFYQVKNPLTMKCGGLGLGLAITKNIIELHGGKIRIESKVGKGTEVGFTLPLVGKE